MKRSLSFSELWAFLECPLLYLALLQRKKQKNTKQKVVGNVTHALADNKGEETQEVRELLTRELSELPPDEQQETLERIQVVAANAQEMAENDEEDDDDTNRESVYRWFFEAIGWTLCAKPDKVDVVTENGRQILEITDYKSGSSYEFQEEGGVISYRAKRKHKEQIYFFALVVSQAMNWKGPIRMRIRYWGNKTECKPMWYSHFQTSKKLDEVTRYIRRIEEYVASQKFPANTGFWCQTCPRSDTCDAYQAQLQLLAPRAATPIVHAEEMVV